MTLVGELLEASRRRARRERRVTPLAELHRQVAVMPPAPRFEATCRRKRRELRADAGVIEPGRCRMRLDVLAVIGLGEKGEGAVQDAR